MNNAGIGGGEPVAGSDVARWRRTIDTNVTGTYLVTRATVPLMVLLVTATFLVPST